MLLVVIGFQPLKTSMKYELATLLLIANILHWMSPETFRRWEGAGGDGNGERGWWIRARIRRTFAC